MNLSELRQNYTQSGLSETEVDHDPFRQFEFWMRQAIAMQLIEPNAVTLATVDPSGQPSARTVLLKGVDARGFVFYTNYESRKARDIETNPRVALLFFWDVLHRQVRVQGNASRISEDESDEYFRSRPRGNQLGSWVSHQSAVISGREVLQESLAETERRFSSSGVPRPPHWGGYRVTPTSIEFWQGRPNRLHDRLEYFVVDGTWAIRRLSP